MTKQLIQKYPEYYDFLNNESDEKIWKEYVALNNSNMYLWREERQEKKALVESILEKRSIEVDFWLEWTWYYIFRWIINKTKDNVFKLVQK